MGLGTKVESNVDTSTRRIAHTARSKTTRNLPDLTGSKHIHLFSEFEVVRILFSAVAILATNISKLAY